MRSVVYILVALSAVSVLGRPYPDDRFKFQTSYDQTEAHRKLNSGLTATVWQSDNQRHKINVGTDLNHVSGHVNGYPYSQNSWGATTDYNYRNGRHSFDAGARYRVPFNYGPPQYGLGATYTYTFG